MAKIHPLTGEPKNGHARPEVLEALLANHKRRPVRGTYDAAQTSDDHKNYWAAADSFDADSANSRSVRETLVPRSRYETGNNGYTDGIHQTYATDLVGIGPTLQMDTGSPGFNRLVEFQWQAWAKAVLLRRKLWCQAHAKSQDGEGFGVARTNPGIDHAVKLDYVLYETEQFQTPALGFVERGYIDGVRFDGWGNPVWYDLLTDHPGSSLGIALQPERVPAAFVCHWYRLRRPGQHRGVPENTSTLDVGAGSRRWREATIAAAETAADFAVLMKTQMSPDEADAIIPLTAVEIQKRMLTALPMGWEASQMRAEHPSATYESFHRAQVSEQARPKSMPYNKAACDSSDYNFASGRLDHQTYYGALDVCRADGGDLVLDKLFNVWWDEAVRVFGWLGGDPRRLNPAARAHSWKWPKHFAADSKSEAQANELRLRTGQTTLGRIWAAEGLDFEDELPRMAAEYGVTPDEMRQVLREAIF